MLLSAAALSTLLAVPAASQEPTRADLLCLWPETGATCRSYVTYELTFHQPLLHHSNRGAEQTGEPTFQRMLDLAVGLEANVAGPWALGVSGSITLGGIREESRGLWLHGRRWLGTEWAVEVVPGLFDVSPGDLRAAPLRGAGLAARIHRVNTGFVGVRYDRIRIAEDMFSRLRPGVEGQLALEAGLESKPATIVTIVGLAGLLVLGAAVAGIAL